MFVRLNGPICRTMSILDWQRLKLLKTLFTGLQNLQWRHVIVRNLPISPFHLWPTWQSMTQWQYQIERQWRISQASPVGSIQSFSLRIALSPVPPYWTGCPRLHWRASSPQQPTATSSAVLCQRSHDRIYVWKSEVIFGLSQKLLLLVEVGMS